MRNLRRRPRPWWCRARDSLAHKDKLELRGLLERPGRLALPAQKGLLERLGPPEQPGRLAPLAHRRRLTRAGNSQHMVGGRGWRREAVASTGTVP